MNALLEKLAPCWFWFKGVVTGDVTLAQRERRLYEFNRSDLPLLTQGQVFLLVQHNDSLLATADTTSQQVSTTSTAFLEKKFTSIAAAASEKLGIKTPPKPLEKVLVRFSIPAKHGLGTSSSGDGDTDQLGNSLLGRVMSTVVDAEKPTISLVWSSLALEKNQPRCQGIVPLHRVQVCREKGTGWAVLDHEGVVLLEVKFPPEIEQASLEAGKWVGAITNALGVLAPQLEEEAAASRGSSYREKRLEQLKVRQEEREKQKQAMGLDKVGMTYTAKAMMKT